MTKPYKALLLQPPFRYRSLDMMTEPPWLGLMGDLESDRDERMESIADRMRICIAACVRFRQAAAAVSKAHRIDDECPLRFHS